MERAGNKLLKAGSAGSGGFEVRGRGGGEERWRVRGMPEAGAQSVATVRPREAGENTAGRARSPILALVPSLSACCGRWLWESDRMAGYTRQDRHRMDSRPEWKQ